MAWHDKISLAQARKDLDYLRNNYGEVNDFCGAWCEQEKLFDVLYGKISIKETIIDLITAYFINGIECGNHSITSDVKPDLEDKRVQKIIDRYYIVVED